jgi:threonine/homoserine/homoserine lactone efflux protein
MMPHLAAFVVVAVVVIVTPGPDTALTIRNTLLGGRRSGVFTGIGVAAGQATWTFATSAGLAALLVASEPVFRAVRYAGAVYLAFLGAQSLLAAVRRDGESKARSATRAQALAPAAALRQGFLSNVTNPKMIAFFPAFLPEFASAASPAFVALLLLGLAFSAMTLLWLSGYAFAVAKVGDVLRRGRAARCLAGATGAVLIGLGLRVATESR